jgi:hypothetical protein
MQFGSLAILAAIRRASSLPPDDARKSYSLTPPQRPLRSFVVRRWCTGISNTEAVVIYGRFALLARHVIAVQDVISLGAPGIRLLR